MKVINHFCHEHPLILTENVANEEEPCYACRNPICRQPAYVCSQQYCDSKTLIHKKCAESPKHILHPSHDHPLHLFDYQENRYSYNCNLCNGEFRDVLGYRCRGCDYDIDILCQQLDSLEEKTLQHPSHRHPLTLMRKPPALFYCDGCGVEGRDMVYVCSACEFWLHDTCATLPIPFPTRRHHHQLTLGFCFPFQFRKFEFECDVCHGEFNVVDWVCYCGDCRFFAHIKCAISTKATEEININEQKKDCDDLIQLPADDISMELISPFVIRATQSNGDGKDASMEIVESSFKHHKHPLSLVTERQMMADEWMMICDACVTPIHSLPFYNCATCKNYYLHSSCHSLPKTIHLDSQTYGDCILTRQHHSLKAHTISEMVENTLCWICKFVTSGVVYECEECKLRVDVKCAALPPTITHSFHPHHELVLRRVSDEEEVECKACEEVIKSRFLIAYYCSIDGCDFAMDLRCVLLPKKVRHHWDKLHPLLLTHDASLDHPTDFYCDMCEEEMHPKKWMYHCRHCDCSFHFGCLTASGRYRNIKFGREFEFDVCVHPHPLTYNRVALKLRCDACQENVHEYPGFECALCNFVICENCGVRELGKL